MIIAEAVVLFSVSTAVAAERGPEPYLLASGPVRAAQSAPAAATDDSVAITVFSNISGAAPDDWIGTGIVETLAADLEGAGVSVVGRQAVSGAITQLSAESNSAEANVEAAVAAGRLLGTRWAISGGYQRLGERMRITARVVEVTTATVVHTAIVDGTVGELFALQDRLAAELRRGVAWGGREATPVATSGEPVIADVEARAPVSVESPVPAAVAAPRASGGALAAAPPRVINGPAPPLAPATIARDAAGLATVRAVRLTEPVRVDGTLDEGVYETVLPVSDFIQQLPDQGAPATERTEAWVFYDARSVYISARVWDSAPESEWIANEMQRDSFQISQNDAFSIVIDTFYDRRNGVGFMINPIGGFFDVQITDESSPNMDWNPIWDVRTGRFEGGWTVETEIPFKSLCFRPGVSQIWGLQLGRRVRRKSETSYLTPVPINANPGEMRISAGGTLTGIEVPRGNKTIEIKPYAIGSLATDVNAIPRISNAGDGAFGLDAKYGVTQNLTADFTYNTDFAQVEVDEQQVNLTRFSLFFPEKREFFLEGQGIFDFGRSAGGRGGPGGGRGGGGFFGGGGDVPTVFFSRRIGLEQGQTVPILGGGPAHRQGGSV